MSAADTIVFDEVSKFYGSVLGVNRVDLELAPGLTALVGPNGSGKSTLMNLISGLLRPSAGSISVYGVSPSDPENLFPKLGYCSQFDDFPRGITGRQLVRSMLRLHGYGGAELQETTEKALDMVGMTEAANRRVAGYSKGMRQRIKLAQAVAHGPRALILDEPLNGLDPMARSELIGFFRDWAQAGRHVLISSHILHEVDMIADQVVMVNQGYVVAEGDIPDVREEIVERPIQVSVRCSGADELAAALFREADVQAVILHEDRQGLVIHTRKAESFHLALNRLVNAGGHVVEAVEPLDQDAYALYEYLITDPGGGLS